ncbi:alpha-L-rhamnosidase [Nitzschia inconspicua]|uniref:Alpha-L-rhamnosidase n=1 Tax=Nitzschia inconspicua TaxID=303405 RepID=A0A9K3KQQ7_9STRA|nr:alpha-L-rhamnosidase [Nitzschia inconspicua]
MDASFGFTVDLDEEMVVRTIRGSVATTSVQDGNDISVTSLTTEYLEDPMGVDKPIPRVSWQIQVNDEHVRSSSQRSITQQSYQLHVKTTPMSLGDDDDDTVDCCGWIDCGWVVSNQTHLVPLQCNSVTPFTKSDIDIEWKVSIRLEPEKNGDNKNTSPVIVSDAARFRTAIVGSWNAKWITGGTLLRKEFTMPDVKHYATLFVSGIGYHHVYLDGKKVGDHQLDPGWTDFSKRVWYSTYDMTTELQQRKATTTDNKHVLSVILGNGWWSCGPPPGTNQPMCSSDPPQLILQLHVDGKPVLVSDETWSVSNDSPVQYNSLYNGETFDARVAERIHGWQSPGYITATSSWSAATLSTSVATKARLVSQLFPPIRHISTTPPVTITIVSQPSTGTAATKNITQLVDFGQNQAAVVRLKRIHCSRGMEITMRHAEVLMHPPYGDFDGTTIYTDNLRTAQATDRYICSGDPKGETYTPLFTQHGFRYVEISGLDHTLELSDLEAVELHTDVQRTSYLHFTDPLLEQIQDMVLSSLMSNLMSVQTDCPQRDERRGWMGDAALTAEIAALSFGMGAFYTHWLDQMMDAQNPNNGGMPNFVPPLNSEPDGAPNWQTAYVMILWVLSTHYGDQEVLLRHHESIVRYYYFLELSYNQTGIAKFREKYGDWCPPPPHPKAYEHLTGAFAFLGDLKLGMDIFRNSPHPDAPFMLRRLTELFTKTAPEFHDSFYNVTTGVYMSGLQTEQALPLYLGVVPDDVEQSVLNHLISDIEVTNGGHTTSGIIGIKYEMEALSILGRGDVALDLALQTTYPSWGYMLQNQYEPSTTVWELWNSDTSGPGMNSRNHHMFGSVAGWMYKYVAGIAPLKPGFAHVQIKPNVLRLDGISAKVASPHGDIKVFYSKREAGLFGYDITLPPGTTGTFIVPIAMDDINIGRTHEGHPMEIEILESGRIIWSDSGFVAGVAGILGAARENDHVHLELGNGSYQFQVSVAVNLELKDQ